jgi:hypothetical protein
MTPDWESHLAPAGFEPETSVSLVSAERQPTELISSSPAAVFLSNAYAVS